MYERTWTGASSSRWNIRSVLNKEKRYEKQKHRKSKAKAKQKKKRNRRAAEKRWEEERREDRREDNQTEKTNKKKKSLTFLSDGKRKKYLPKDELVSLRYCLSLVLHVVGEENALTSSRRQRERLLSMIENRLAFFIITKEKWNQKKIEKRNSKSRWATLADSFETIRNRRRKKREESSLPVSFRCILRLQKFCILTCSDRLRLYKWIVPRRWEQTTHHDAFGILLQADTARIEHTSSLLRVSRCPRYQNHRVEHRQDARWKKKQKYKKRKKWVSGAHLQTRLAIQIPFKHGSKTFPNDIGKLLGFTNHSCAITILWRVFPSHWFVPKISRNLNACWANSARDCYKLLW